jgi:hypothetical protein
VYGVVFTPDGRRLISASGDRSLKVWDVSQVDLDESPACLCSEALEKLWDDLASEDAARAYRARRMLAVTPEQAFPLLKARTKVMELPKDAERRVERLLSQLDSREFATREEATNQIRAMTETALPVIRRAMDRPLSLEVRHRLADLLEESDSPVLSGELLRSLRVISILEHYGTSEAESTLKKLADGLPEALQTREAHAALERLAHRREERP